MAELVRAVARTLWSDGGQRTARRNAWAAMVADARRARERAEAAAEFAAVETSASGSTARQAVGS